MALVVVKGVAHNTPHMVCNNTQHHTAQESVVREKHTRMGMAACMACLMQCGDGSGATT